MAIRTTRTSSWLTSTTDLPTTGAWTLCALARLNTDHNANAQLLGAMGTSPATNYWCMETDTDGTTLLFYSQSDRTLGVSATVGEWFFIAMRKPGATGGHGIVIELDTGTLTKNEDDTTNYVDAFTQFLIGNYDTDTGSGVDADFAAIKYWDAALTDAELMLEAYSLRPRRTADLNRWSPGFHSVLADAIKDYSGNGRDWSQYGTPAVADGPPVGWGAPIWIPQYAVASGIPVLSAGSMSSITATTAVPRVTLTF